MIDAHAYRWSPADDARVRLEYPTADVNALAESLGVPLHRLRDRAHRLGVRRVRHHRQLKPCAECGQSVYIQAWGLCSKCYKVPAIRDAHAAAIRCDPYEDFLGPGDPCVPTAALPGSEAKISVLAARVAADQELFHPDDAGMPRVFRNKIQKLKEKTKCVSATSCPTPTAA